jgi:antitoxin YefM
MTETSYTKARERLAALCDAVASTREPVIIHRRGAEDVALIAASELSSLTETAHLMRSPKNAERILTALARARAGEGSPLTPDELRRELGLEETD